MNLPAVRRSTKVYVVYALLIHLAIYIGFKTVAYQFGDFGSLYSAGKILASTHRASLYDPTVTFHAPGQNADQSSRSLEVEGLSLPPDRAHPPFEIMLYSVLAQFPFRMAYTLWFLFNSALIVLCPIILQKWLPSADYEPGFTILACGVAYPALVALVVGQPSVLVLALLTAVFILLRSDRDDLAGIALALAMSKFQIALILFVGLAALRGRRFIAGFVGGCAALLTVSVVVIGLSGMRGYIAMLLAFSHQRAWAPAIPAQGLWTPAIPGLDQRAMVMPNIRGFIERAFAVSGMTDYKILVLAILSVAMVALQFSMGKRFRHSAQEHLPLLVAFMISVATLTAYHEFTHDLVILLLPMWLAWNHAAKVGGRTRLFLGIAIGAVCGLPYLAPGPTSIFVAQVLLCSNLALRLYLADSEPSLSRPVPLIAAE